MDEIYGTNLWVQDKKFMKLVLIFMENAKQSLCVGKSQVFQLNMETFSTDCQAVYSLYNVLQNFKQFKTNQMSYTITFSMKAQLHVDSSPLEALNYV